MRRFLVVIAMVGVLGGCTQILPELNIGAGVSGVMPKDKDNVDGTYVIDLFAKVDVWFLQVEAALGYKEFDVVDGTTGDTVELTQMPFVVSARFLGGPAVFRFNGGLGLVYNINDISEIGGLSASDSLAYRLIVGFDSRLISRFRLGAEAYYEFTDDDIGNLNVDTDNLGIRMTLAYNF